MDRLKSKLHTYRLRKYRVRSKVNGTKDCPRLAVYISNKHIIAQIIDDTKHSTLVHVTTVGSKDAKGTMKDRAVWVGTQIAKSAKLKKINNVVFDRGGRLYHGRVKALADAARKEGLEF